MIVAVWAPLLLPFLAAPLARRLAETLTPRAAAWTLAGTSAVLAGGTLCSLGLLAAAGLLRLPPVAALGHLSLPWLAATAPQAPLPAVLAGLTLAALGVLAARTARLRHRELHAARAALGPDTAALPADGPTTGSSTTNSPHASARRAHTPRARLASLPARARALLSPAGPAPLAVLDDERADAFALPGRLPHPRRPAEPGRIVVTTGMLRALTAPERAALFGIEQTLLACADQVRVTTSPGHHDLVDRIRAD
ncbi:hypothetical protein ABZ885_20775, partial [Kitasatospora sp. NPDC047058]